MFGFLNAPCSGCNSREHSVYRAHFCGLCNRLRQDYGLPMRFLVNRDATFLSLLGTALAPAPAPPVTAMCCNPMGKPRLVVQDGAAVTYAAAVTMCGLQAKLDDELTDRRRGPTRFALRGIRGSVSRSVSKAEAHLSQSGFPVDDVREILGEQSRIEQWATGCGNPDLEALSRPSAFAFGKIVAHTGERSRDSLERIGQSLGRLVYTLDAWVDRKRDERTRQFNPFLLQPRLIHSVPDLVGREQHAITAELRDLPLLSHREVLDVILGRNLQRTCALLLEGNAPAQKDSNKRKSKNTTRQNHASNCCDGGNCCDAWDCIFCCDFLSPSSFDCCGDCGCGCDACCDCT